MTVLGAGLLWFGWFGFNAGSALAANGLAADAFVTTNTAAAMAALTWVTIELAAPRARRHRARRGVGAVAGLVGDHAGGGLREPVGGGPDRARRGRRLLRRVAAPPAARASTTRSTCSRVHGVGGAFGARWPRACSRTMAVNAAGRDGLLAGVPGQVAIQLVGVGVVAIYSAAMTAAILLAVNGIVRIRVPRDAEEAGLDLAQHGEIAYGA